MNIGDTVRVRENVLTTFEGMSGVVTNIQTTEWNNITRKWYDVRFDVEVGEDYWDNWSSYLEHELEVVYDV